jgi:hypothetical protein
LILEVPEQVILADGTTAAVKGVAASVVDGRLERVTYTVEKENGGWADVAETEAHSSDLAAEAPAPAAMTAASLATENT